MYVCLYVCICVQFLKASEKKDTERGKESLRNAERKQNSNWGNKIVFD